jgi:hypothetical protein
MFVQKEEELTCNCRALVGTNLGVEDRKRLRVSEEPLRMSFSFLYEAKARATELLGANLTRW